MEAETGTPEWLSQLWEGFEDNPVSVMRAHVAAVPEDAQEMAGVARWILEQRVKGEGFLTVQVRQTMRDDGQYHVVLDLTKIDEEGLRALAHPERLQGLPGSEGGV